MLTASIIVLVVSAAALVAGRALATRELQRHAARMHAASALVSSAEQDLFNAIHAMPQFHRPVLVWLCPHCGLYAFVAKDCPRCHVRMPEEAGASWMVEADVITQGRPRV